MLEKFSKILYIFLGSLFVLALIIYAFKWSVHIDTKIFYFVFLLVLPFLEMLIESVRKSFSFWNLSIKHEDNLLKYIWIIVFWIISYFYGLELSTIGILCFLAFSILFKIDSRLSFIWALMFLLIIPLYMILWDKESAETVSIFAYYMLIIWVIIEIYNQIFQKKSENIESKNSESVTKDESTSMFFQEMKELSSELINTAKEKIIDTKNNILEEIGEWEKIQTKSEPIISQPIEKTKEVIKSTKQNFYVKLLTYFVKKIKENIVSITLMLFSLAVISTLILLWYSSFETVVKYLFILLLISYFSSKLLWKKYDLTIVKSHTIRSISKKKLLSKDITIEDAVVHNEEISAEKIENISTARNQNIQTLVKKRNKFFLNKAIIFASFWLMFWYFLLEYFTIKDNSVWIYIWIFSLFFLVYYFIYSDLDSRLLKKSKIVWAELTTFSIKDFLKRHIYILLNLILILSILSILWFKTWIFAEWYKTYKSKVWYENWVLTPEAILKNETDEKIRLWELLKPKIDLYSQEVQVKDPAPVEVKTEIKNIADIYTFTQTLSEWSVNEEVEILEGFMKKLWYFDKAADTTFDTETKSALTNLLQTECSWPASTKWIFWNLASQCLYTLDIEVEIESNEENSDLESLSPSEIISNEAQINVLKPDDIIQEEDIESVVADVQAPQTEKKNIGDIYRFTQTLSEWSKNEEVKILEGFMVTLGYFNKVADTTFDTETKSALTNLLQTECSWPDSTKGILWNQAMQCLYKLEVEANINN